MVRGLYPPSEASRCRRTQEQRWPIDRYTHLVSANQSSRHTVRASRSWKLRAEKPASAALDCLLFNGSNLSATPQSSTPQAHESRHSLGNYPQAMHASGLPENLGAGISQSLPPDRDVGDRAGWTLGSSLVESLGYVRRLNRRSTGDLVLAPLSLPCRAFLDCFGRGPAAMLAEICSGISFGRARFDARSSWAFGRGSVPRKGIFNNGLGRCAVLGPGRWRLPRRAVQFTRRRHLSESHKNRF